MNRGSVADVLDNLGTRRRGFNEAPIHESGKSLGRRSSGHGPLRFNEAPIHESGKSHPGLNGWIITERFNEAPIHESGKYFQRRRSPSRIFRFNEAPIHESGKYLAGDARMVVPVASMRPRFMNRGSCQSSLNQISILPASMRPRFMNRGSPADGLAVPARRPRFNEAPIHESGKCR